MLQDYDGYDLYASGDDLSARNAFIQYQPTNALGPFVTIRRPGRFGAGACVAVSSLLSTFGTFAPVFAARNQEFIIGIAAKTISGFSPPSDDSLIMAFTDTIDNDQQFLVQFSKITSQVLIWSPGWLGFGEFVPFGTVAYTSPAGAWTVDDWNFLEVHARVDPTNGFIRVQVTKPDKTVKVVADVQGIQTQRTTNRSVDAVLFGHPWFGTSDFLFDDLYYCDATIGPGSFPCNDFLGDVTSITVLPRGTAAAQWTPKDVGLLNREEVANQIFAGDAHYNLENVAGHRDLFDFQPFNMTVSAVFGVGVFGAYRKDDAGLREIKQGILSGSREWYGPTYSLPDTYHQFYHDIWRVKPDTLKSFTDVDLNAIAAGYKLAA